MRFVCLNSRRGAVRHASCIIRRWGPTNVDKSILRTSIRNKCLFSIETSRAYRACGCVLISAHRGIITIEILAFAPQAYAPCVHSDLITFAISLYPSHTGLCIVIPKLNIPLQLDFRKIGMVVTRIYPSFVVMKCLLPIAQADVHMSEWRNH